MIDPSTIEEIRRRVPLSSVIGERVKLTRRGRSLTGLCPFHKEKTPSFHVNDERGFYHCFGCSASGDLIAFLRETEGLNFTEAVESLAERAGIEVQEQRSDHERREAQAAQRQKSELYEVGEAAAIFFERSMEQHALKHYAIAELRRRDLDPERGGDAVEAALRAFRVGYAPPGWDGLTEYLRRAGLSLTAAEKVGLIVSRKTGSGYYDRFRQRLMFAVLDLRGRIVAFSGRALEPPSDAELRELSLGSAGPSATEVAKYMNSPESAIYRKREVLFGLHQARNSIRERDNCVVVEGNFDVVSLHARGLTHVVAPLGTAFTTEQAQEIKRYSGNVTLLFDGDKAGQRASRAARAPCLELGLSAKVATLPPGKDPDDVIREQGSEGITNCLRAARSMLEYLIDSALEQGFSAADAHSRAAKIKEVTELITSEQDPTVRGMAERYADSVAVRLGIADARTFRALRAVVLQAATQGANQGASQGGATPNADKVRALPPESARSRAREADIETEILGALLEYPELLDDEAILTAIGDAEGNTAQAIAALIQGRKSGVDAMALIDRMPPQLRPFVAQRLAAPLLDDLEQARATIEDNATKLRRLIGKHRERELLQELHRAAVSGDVATETALLEERMRRARERRGLKA